jgi:hypothetical protein
MTVSIPAIASLNAPAQPLGSATLTGASEAVFRVPDGPRGWYKHGLRTENDGARDWRAYYGLQMGVFLPSDKPMTLEASLKTPADETVSASVTIAGKGWHAVTLPWSVFAFDQARSAFLKYAKEVRVKVRPVVTGKIVLSNVRVVRAETVALDSNICGKSAERGQTVEYLVRVGNCTAKAQSVTLQFERHGWEAMTASVTPSQLTLGPGETKMVMAHVVVSDRVPPGGHEVQTLRAIANGDAARGSSIEFATASALPHPYIVHTPERWREVLTKVANYSWAKDAQNDYLKRSDKWVVPQITQPPDNDPDDTMGPFVFRTPSSNDLLDCGVAWQLTHDKKYAEKVATYMRRLSDPSAGYPKTLRACSQSLVQEGQFFQLISMGYDMTLDSGVYSDVDKKQIETTFRMFMDTIAFEMEKGSINNWNLAEDVGAFYCALTLQDLSAANHFFTGPAGIQDQMAKGTMDDGWWYECSISYNVWCASEFSQVALAYAPWGVNFKDMKLPASYSLEALLSAPDGGGSFNGGNPVKTNDLVAQRRPFGMSKEIWGPMLRPSREIRDLWNGLPPFIDYRGVMFGVNDSTENLVGGYRPEIGAQPFELAYMLYRDPAYAAQIPKNGKRDLLYGVGELPADTPNLYTQSAYADNVGLTMLRSQTDGRPIREQIQAALHYGTHGWAHGHYDRTNLLNLMRYGRSFYNPEAMWFGYEPFMYKFYVQTSDASNMVVVDQKMQEASPGDRLLFHTGKMMQATAVQTDTRWSNPPYGGMVYDYVPVKTFEEKTWREGRYVPIPKNQPAYGSLTDYTEKILQRRLMVVTDDYVLLADYLKGNKPHTFDSLFQMKGFQGLEAPGKTYLRHDAQWNPDPVGSAQFVTDCDWWTAQAPARSQFTMQFGPGADNAGTRALYSEDGPLNLDIYSLWPAKQQIMVATAPEDHGVQKQLTYAVRGGDKTLTEGKFGAWILGKADIDLPVTGLKQLDLQASIAVGSVPTVFWANARIVTNDGHEIPLSKLPVTYENTQQPKGPNLDYFGGPVKIEGVAYDASTPGQPLDVKKPSVVHIDLTGVDAVRFKTTLGGDYPLGNESQRRKTYSIRSQGTEARFLTVIEPFEDKNAVQKAEAPDADHIRVTLIDGRVQEIALRGFTGDGKAIDVEITETKNGKTVRSESTTSE